MELIQNSHFIHFPDISKYMGTGSSVQPASKQIGGHNPDITYTPVTFSLQSTEASPKGFTALQV